MPDQAPDGLRVKNGLGWASSPGADDGAGAAQRVFNGPYRGEELEHVAFPLGGIGTGMICLEGRGGLSNLSLRHHPHLAGNPRLFAALSFPGTSYAARILEGPVPRRYLQPDFGARKIKPFGSWGLPRFRDATFEARFPFARVALSDDACPVSAEIVGWSPFTPPDHDSSSLPICAVEYRFTNETTLPVEALFSFHAENFLALPAPDSADGAAARRTDRIAPASHGFILTEQAGDAAPWREGQFMAWVDGETVSVDHSWLRADDHAQIEMLWSDIQAGRIRQCAADPAQSSPGASLWVPIAIKPGESRTVTLRFAWYVPESDLAEPSFDMADGVSKPVEQPGPRHRPWYATRFPGIDALRCYWDEQYPALKERTETFTRCFYGSTLAPELVEAVAANLTTLKSPTILRQADGRLWGWEGSYEDRGMGYGSSNHVWNYAQAFPHLFPALERSLRETELGDNLGADGYQASRAALPIRAIGDSREDGWGFPSAADGQLGCLLKLYRDWRISGDTAWLQRLWPKATACIDYCIRTWDPKRTGRLEEPHVTTYDREFWGTNSLCMSLYVGALKAAILMGQALGEQVDGYVELHALARGELARLFNGEYFVQDIDLGRLETPFPSADHDLFALMDRFPEYAELAIREGPHHQVGNGCLSDGVFGVWLAETCGMDDIMGRSQARDHLLAVHRYNLKTARDISNPMRPIFASDDERGLVVCSWPHGSRPAVPIFFSDLVWTGVEYQVASHLIRLGEVDKGLEIVRCARERYDGRQRNPFAEIEAGHWYVRAMSSYALLQAISGARYDAIDRTIIIEPAIAGDFRCFLATASGFGLIGVQDGKPVVDIMSGNIAYQRVDYRPYGTSLTSCGG